MLEKQARQIILADIQEFCAQRIPESRWLDYKEDCKPGDKENYKASKIIAALANAHGGWILFGISEEKDSQNRGIPGKILGASKQHKIGERIKQIALDRVYPPVVVEVGACEVDDDNEIVVVRVLESESAPHELTDGKIYIRTNDISHLADDGRTALVKEIELLLNRREKSKENKVRLLSRAQSRWQLNKELPQVQLACIPTFPSEPICQLSNLPGAATPRMKYWAFKQSAGHLHTAGDSIYQSFERSSGVEEHLRAIYEFNIYGLVYYTSYTIAKQKPAGDARYGINSQVIAALLWSILRASGEFYRMIDFAGLVDVSLTMKTEGQTAALTDQELQITMPMADRSFVVTRRVLSERLNDINLVIDMYREFLWAAGAGIPIMTSDRPDRLVRSIERDLGT